MLSMGWAWGWELGQLESIGFDCCAAEDAVLLAGRKLLAKTEHDFVPPFVAARDQADRPVAAEHYALWAEGVEHCPQINGNVRCSPCRPIGFGHQAGDF